MDIYNTFVSYIKSIFQQTCGLVSRYHWILAQLITIQDLAAALQCLNPGNLTHLFPHLCHVLFPLVVLLGP